MMEEVVIQWRKKAEEAIRGQHELEYQHLAAVNECDSSSKATSCSTLAKFSSSVATTEPSVHNSPTRSHSQIWQKSGPSLARASDGSQKVFFGHHSTKQTPFESLNASTRGSPNEGLLQGVSKWGSPGGGAWVPAPGSAQSGALESSKGKAGEFFTKIRLLATHRSASKWSGELLGQISSVQIEQTASSPAPLSQIVQAIGGSAHEERRQLDARSPNSASDRHFATSSTPRSLRSANGVTLEDLPQYTSGRSSARQQLGQFAATSTSRSGISSGGHPIPSYPSAKSSAWNTILGWSECSVSSSAKTSPHGSYVSRGNSRLGLLRLANTLNDSG
eukprot:gene8098-1342_t